MPSIDRRLTAAEKWIATRRTAAAERQEQPADLFFVECDNHDDAEELIALRQASRDGRVLVDETRLAALRQTSVKDGELPMVDRLGRTWLSCADFFSLL
ncbi:MAG: hypothetical protein NTY19_26060 [Planctomycetota bacterium]|nr:hypothetical protein [Planctomycetota bacterium]